MKRYIRSAYTTRWIDLLPEDVYNRLAACNNRKSDLPILVDAKWKWMKDNGKEADGFTKEDALVAVLEHLDSNSQDFLADLTVDEYDELKSEPGKFTRSYTTKFTTNEEWAAWISRKLKLSPEEADIVLEDLENDQCDEWIEIMEANGIDPKDIRSFKSFLAGVTASTNISAKRSISASYDFSEPIDTEIQSGLFWDIDGHRIEVIEKVGSLRAKVKESWIAEDTGEEKEDISMYDIGVDNKDNVKSEYIYDPKYPDYRMYAGSAFNYPYDEEWERKQMWDKLAQEQAQRAREEYNDEDDYTPSATRGDYSPSSPWNAPGMSMHDFI